MALRNKKFSLGTVPTLAPAEGHCYSGKIQKAVDTKSTSNVSPNMQRNQSHHSVKRGFLPFYGGANANSRSTVNIGSLY